MFADSYKRNDITERNTLARDFPFISRFVLEFSTYLSQQFTQFSMSHDTTDVRLVVDLRPTSVLTDWSYVGHIFINSIFNLSNRFIVFIIYF
jgi:hypothetical protein